MTTVLNAQDISVSYGRKAVLHGANLAASQGDIVALLGPNGAGKTTLIKAILGLVASRGGIDITENIGILLDDGGLLPGLTGRQHLHAVALFHGKTGTDEALQLVDMAYAADQKISTYSLGMKRRIALAAALIAQPTLLLPPTASTLKESAGSTTFCGTTRHRAMPWSCAPTTSPRQRPYPLQPP